nr:hypothetical protein [Tanacetum cinerariifolium]
MNVGSEEGHDAEDDDEELYRDVNINLEGMLNPSPDACIDSLFESTPWVDVQALTTVAPLTLTAPTLPPPTILTISQFAGAVSSIPGIVERYMDQRMNEAVKTSDAVAADLSELELKKILIKKMESNKSIYRSDEQRNLYKALVNAYECDKIIMDTYGYIVTLKRHRDDADKDEEPSAGSDRGSKRRREGKEPESTSAPKDKASKTTGKSTKGSKSYQKTTSESAPVEEPMQTTQDLEEPSHQEFKTGVADDQPIAEASQHPECDLAKQADFRSSFNELMDTPVDFSAFLMNRLKVDTLTPKLLAGLTYELIKGSCKSLVELEFFLEEIYKVTTNQLDWNNPEGQQYPHNLLKPLPLIPNSLGHRVILFDHFINNDLEYLRGGASSHVYSKRRIIAVTELQIVEWHNYKHLDWITVRIDDDKLYKFKEGDFKRLRIQDIKDMLLLLVLGKMTNLMVEDCFAFNISLRMFTRSIVIQRRVEDLQLGVESYEKNLNLTKPDMYRSNLKHKEAYIVYSNPSGFIYQNNDKQNRLMQIDKLHKFSDGKLNDVRTTLDDRLKVIQMKYLPQAIWRRSDKERAATMIQAIDKQLKTRRIMRSLEKFVAHVSIKVFRRVIKDSKVVVGCSCGGDGSVAGALGTSTSSSSFAAGGYGCTNIVAKKGVSTLENPFPTLRILANTF